jgi:glycosyltransferase involved in cell wall biosynthesis
MRDSVLAVCDFSANLEKVERHIQPLAAVAETTMVCITASESVTNVGYRTVPSFGRRPIGLLLMFVAALFEGLSEEYDAIVSFSLIPHGMFALVVGRLSGTPVHLGIIGADLDVHAKAAYGPAVAFLIRRFDAVSVPGTTHERQLVEMGVPPSRITILTNPIDETRYTAAPRSTDQEYDFVWVGRFDTEKHPRLFTDALVRLHERGVSFRAAMVGDGPLRSSVERELRARGLADAVDLPGWVDDPLAYYHRARIFALTSRRDALPLTLVEAMATGCAPVVPPVGNVSDVVEDGRNGVVLEGMDAESLSEELRRLRSDRGLTERLATNATAIADRFSYGAASDDWERILRVMCGEEADGSEGGAVDPGRTTTGGEG